MHFEIRNTKTEHPLNPELFGLPIIDKIAPKPVEAVFYRGHIYEDGNGLLHLPGGMDVYKPVSSGDRVYNVNRDTVHVPAGLTGVGVNVDDYMDGSDNTITFYTAGLYMDDSLQCMVTLDDIGYDVSTIHKRLY